MPVKPSTYPWNSKSSPREGFQYGCAGTRNSPDRSGGGCCGDHSDLIGRPALVEWGVHAVVRIVQCRVNGEATRPTDSPSRPLGGSCSPEGVRDSFDVAKILVDAVGDEPDTGVGGSFRGRSVPLSVDTLLVRERVRSAVVGLLQAREQGLPPQQGEVLLLVDDDGVQFLLDGQDIRELL